MLVPEVNCFSFVYHDRGVDPIEKYRHPSPLTSLLEDFEIVPKSKAEVVAVVPFEPTDNVRHVAILENNRKTILHRPDVDLAVTTDPFSVLKQYLKLSPRATLVYLAHRSKSK